MMVVLVLPSTLNTISVLVCKFSTFTLYLVMEACPLSTGWLQDKLTPLDWMSTTVKFPGLSGRSGMTKIKTLRLSLNYVV